MASLYLGRHAHLYKVTQKIWWPVLFFQFVRDENERSLREAMMLSKLDFEEKKDFYAQMKKEQQEDHKGGKGKKKKDKPLTMSLDQFNSLRPDQVWQTGKQVIIG